MSFDVFMQGFDQGDALAAGGSDAAAALAPYWVATETSEVNNVVHYGDGGAEIHLCADSLMATHIWGDDTWDLLVAVARRANWVFLIPGAPTAIVSPSQQNHLPPELSDDATLVTSGAQLLRLIQAG